MRTTAPLADFAFDPDAVAQVEGAHDLGGDKDVVVRLGEIALRVAEETETLAADLDNALGKYRVARRFIFERHTGVGRTILTAAARAAIITRTTVVSRSTVIPRSTVVPLTAAAKTPVASPAESALASATRAGISLGTAAVSLCVALGGRQRRIGPVRGQSRFAFVNRQGRGLRGVGLFHSIIGESVAAGYALAEAGGVGEFGMDAGHVVVVAGDLFRRRGKNFPRLTSSAP